MCYINVFEVRILSKTSRKKLLIHWAIIHLIISSRQNLQTALSYKSLFNLIRVYFETISFIYRFLLYFKLRVRSGQL